MSPCRRDPCPAPRGGSAEGGDSWSRVWPSPGWREPHLLPAALPGCRGKWGLADAIRRRCADGLAVVFGEGASCQTGGTYGMGLPRSALTLTLFGVPWGNLCDGEKGRPGEFCPARQK